MDFYFILNNFLSCSINISDIDFWIVKGIPGELFNFFWTINKDTKSVLETISLLFSFFFLVKI